MKANENNSGPAQNKALEISYDRLFDMWAGFDDAEADKEVTLLCGARGLGYIDAVSFMAFCFGYEKAVQKIKEPL